MRNVIFIISHKRIQCSTAHAIQSAGYSGEWYIVADDMDDTEYEKAYGEDRIIRFSKDEYYEKIDTADNFRKYGASVYARVACYDIAERLGADCFGCFDDDLKGFYIRYEDGNRLKSKKVKNLQRIFDAYCRYISDAGIACGAFISSGRLVGGAKNPLVKERFYHNPTNAYIINPHVEQIRFMGTLWEDATYSYQNNMLGHIAMAMMPVAFVMEPPESLQEGGCHDIYEEGASYLAESYANMIIPSFFRWVDGCRGRRFRKDIPRILNEKWRKARSDHEK